MHITLYYLISHQKCFYKQKMFKPFYPFKEVGHSWHIFIFIFSVQLTVNKWFFNLLLMTSGVGSEHSVN